MFSWFVYASIWTFRSPPRIPEFHIPEEPVLQIAAALRIEINHAFAFLRDIASGRDLKKFLSVCPYPYLMYLLILHYFLVQVLLMLHYSPHLVNNWDWIYFVCSINCSFVLYCALYSWAVKGFFFFFFFYGLCWRTTWEWHDVLGDCWLMGLVYCGELLQFPDPVLHW